MIAAWRSWGGGPAGPIAEIARSLGAFAGVSANHMSLGSGAYAQLDGPRPPPARRGWSPARCAAGALVLFDGTFDNIDEISGELGLPVAAAQPYDSARAARVYGEAVARWGDAADRRVHGCYAAIVDLGEAGLRLARSPWSPPPLTWVNDDARAFACSSLRALAAGGVERELDRKVLFAALLGATERDDSGWYRGTFTVAPGSVVHLTAEGARSQFWFDPADLPRVRFRRDEDYVAAANEQLERAVAAALRQARRPGMALSGGLDSGIVADEVLRQLPQGTRLPSFTHCLHPQWRGATRAGTFGDERAVVERFAAMHPALEPRFIDDPERGFDEQAVAFARATGLYFRMISIAAPYQGVWRAAREAGCDWLLTAEYGDTTLSCDPRWAPSEFLRRGRLAESWRALRAIRGDHRPMWRRFAAEAVLPNLPRRLRLAARRAVHGAELPGAETMNVLRPELVAAEGLARFSRHRPADAPFEQARSMADLVATTYYGEMMDAGEFIQGYEQIYGLRHRDVTLYRPLMDLCFGMPTEQFMRGGTGRWLARRMALGRMPEAQRLVRGVGGHHADWHERMTPRVPELRARLERVKAHPWLGQCIDTGRLEALLDDWPEEPTHEAAEMMPRLYSLPLAINAADYVDWLEGRND